MLKIKFNFFNIKHLLKKLKGFKLNKYGDNIANKKNIIILNTLSLSEIIDSNDNNNVKINFNNINIDNDNSFNNDFVNNDFFNDDKILKLKNNI